jgi:hypothetical protein
MRENLKEPDMREVPRKYEGDPGYTTERRERKDNIFRLLDGNAVSREEALEKMASLANEIDTELIQKIARDPSLMSGPNRVTSSELFSEVVYNVYALYNGLKQQT